jgi:hypothetical protein
MGMSLAVRWSWVGLRGACFAVAWGLVTGLGAKPAAATSDAPTEPVLGEGPTLQEADVDGWRLGDPVRLPNPDDVITEPPATGMPRTVSPYGAELQTQLGAAMYTCPPNTQSCSAGLGGAAAVAWVQRPVTWFSWGASADVHQFSQEWALDETWSLHQRTIAGRLLARVHMGGRSGIDPYIGISFGGAAIHDSYRSESTRETSQWLASPLYGARAGITFPVSHRLSVGGMVEWTNLQANTRETCPWTLGGVCSSNNWSAFSPSNALWNVGVTLGFAFGEEL